MWWREVTLEERLDSVLSADSKKWDPLFTRPQREAKENYELGVALLRRHGIRLTLDAKGPYCLHFVEGVPADAEGTERVLKEVFKDADEQLREFWAPLITLRAAGPLRQHARFLLRREQAVMANSKRCSEVERLRDEVAELRARLKKAALQVSEGKTYGDPQKGNGRTIDCD